MKVEKMPYDLEDSIELKKVSHDSLDKEIDEMLKAAAEYENIAKNWHMPEEEL